MARETPGRARSSATSPAGPGQAGGAVAVRPANATASTVTIRDIARSRGTAANARPP